MDAESIEWRTAREFGADRVELYTQSYAEAFARQEYGEVFATYARAANHAQSAGLGVNAGHDLNLQNLSTFCGIPGILEVSIGHALIVDALNIGLANAVRDYLQVLAGSS